MRLYLDSSALTKRSLDEAESEALERALDAHVATAILLNVDAVITYDDRLITACEEAGLAVLAPGR